MPLPLFLAGAAIIAGGYGVKKGLDAKSDYDEADSINKRARNIFDDAESSLNSKREQANSSMLALGRTKFDIYENSLLSFVKSFSQIKNINFNDSDIKGLESLPGVDKADLESLSSSVLSTHDVLSGGVTALGTGGLAGLAAYGGVGFLGTASTGTAIGSLTGVAATNATLAWLGGGSLAAGGYGMAGGAVVLGGLVAGPVLAVGGMMLASKAESAKIDAYSNRDKALLAAEQMKTAEVVTEGIHRRFEEVNDVLLRLNNFFTPMLKEFCALVERNIDYSSYADNDKKLVFKVAATAKSIKNLLEVVIINEDGSLTSQSNNIASFGTALIEGDHPELASLESNIEHVDLKKEPEPKKDLEHYIREVSSHIDDQKWVYALSHGKKLRDKTAAAVKSYAHEDYEVDSDYKSEPYGLLVLIDTTLFGSAKDGFFITDTHIYGKPSYNDRFSIEIKKIKSIRVDEDNRELAINGDYYGYTHTEITPAIKLIVNAIKKYLEQFK
ncbi:hypothetical protein NDQ71_03730 [Pseudoalteromonas sp. KG3]|uniref:hypothetical protein n=1 Tax=Pseudoalteromonas sp. KG3 TaxID=2951137 RepID=UPI002659044E|nr:hypothetical protein [Pseudoalteromonas sp. KG3]WKD24218.1 hypothetical protein NDQ71_03730 [Pseudoalteromonas sp. KG3]